MMIVEREKKGKFRRALMTATRLFVSRDGEIERKRGYRIAARTGNVCTKKSRHLFTCEFYEKVFFKTPTSSLGPPTYVQVRVNFIMYITQTLNII